MPNLLQLPLINGVLHSFASIEADFGGGRKFGSLQSLDYDRKRERKVEYGPHPDPIGKTQGQNKYGGKTSLLLVEWQRFIITQGPGYGDLPFNVVVNYSANGLEIITDILIGCTIDSTEAKQKVGTDGLVRDLDLNPLKILYSGLDDVLIPLVLAGVF